MPIEGLQALVDKLEKITDEKMVTKMQKEALKPVAENILDEMKSKTPVSTRRNIHGIDAEGIFAFRYDGRAGFKVGLTNMGGHGTDYWEQIRGVWFQNFKTDEPNFGWWTNMYHSRKEAWYREARENVRKALSEYLNSL